MVASERNLNLQCSGGHWRGYLNVPLPVFIDFLESLNLRRSARLSRPFSLSVEALYLHASGHPFPQLTPDYGVNRTTWHKLLRLFVGVTKIVLESTKLVNQVSVALQPLSDDADEPLAPTSSRRYARS